VKWTQLAQDSVQLYVRDDDDDVSGFFIKHGLSSPAAF
jgi:hypothetical protein